jgi:ribosome-associated toxin RatA of RatAB toxin-antitoxin module
MLFLRSCSVPTARLLLLTSVCLAGSTVKAADIGEFLNVSTDPRGGVTARARVQVDAPPATLQAVLTDYEHWPELFTGSMRMARVERQADRTITDIYIKHSLLPNEQRLLVESRELPSGGLVTTLLGGDFKRYARTWEVAANGKSGSTADFRLEVEVDTWAPDWLVARMLKGDLEGHFRLMKERAEQVARAAQR